MKVSHLRALGLGAAAVMFTAANLMTHQAMAAERDPAKPVMPTVETSAAEGAAATTGGRGRVNNNPRNVSAPVIVYLDPKSKNAGDGVAEEAATKPALRASRYAALISKYAKAQGVPLTLAHAVVRIESNFNPQARGSAGEIGLMQIKPATARAMGFSGNARDLYDPATNLHWGMMYLAGAHRLAGGDTCGTILRYNGGHYAKRMNPVSARYCRKVQTLLKNGEVKAYAAL